MSALRLKKYYSYFQWLSLDVVIGACAGLFFFQHMLDLDFTLVVYVLMGLAVWGIYTFDHLMDAKNIEGRASSARHLFHQVHYNKLIIWLILVVVMGLYLAFNFIKFSRLISFGLLLGSMIIGNIMVIKFFGKKMAFLKELSTAAFYTAGITLAPLIRFVNGGLPNSFWFFAFGYFLLAWFNLILLAYMDKHSDQRDQMGSIVNTFGVKATYKLLKVIVWIGLIYNLSLFFFLSSHFYIYIIILLIMFLIHALAFFQSQKGKEFVRRQIDAAYMLPLILLFIG
ncbi:UbiA family prenyltransferase [Echinicola salinicaeni]|uniref:UbiA family prenyltransferase n=1 Tax=Echinicola salinicaeni TaxID=2762757 RepID=UPI00293C12EF|nr:UbiA family prenyltransferase [Echinicola salinicaeni]